MSENCNTQINIPEVDNTELDCNEFIDTLCVISPDGVPQLMLPPNSNLTQIITNLTLALENALVRIEALENQILNPELNDNSDVTIAGAADNNILQYNGVSGMWENEVNLELGNFTLDAVNDSIDLNALSTFSFRDAADADIITIDEATRDVTIGNIVFDVSGNIIRSTSGGLDVEANTILSLLGNTRVDITGNIATMTVGPASTTFFNVPVNFDTQNIGDIRGIQSRSGVANPTIADVSDGHYIGWYNTNLSEFRIWYNDAGTMVSSGVFT